MSAPIAGPGRSPGKPLYDGLEIISEPLGVKRPSEIPEPKVKRPSNWVRYVVVGLVLVIIVGGLAGIKTAQIGKLIGFGKAAMKAGPPAEVVNTAVAERQDWTGALTAVANVVSTKGVEVSNDVPGIVSRIFFESGDVVKKGQILAQLDTSVERAQLASVQARGKLAQLSLDRSNRLVQSGALAPAQLDADKTSFHSLAADLKALKAEIERKIVRAPFAGKLGIRQVNVGQYLSPGSPIAVLESTEATYLDFSLPQQQLSHLKIGMPVRALPESGSEPLAGGTILAIDPAVDSTTRTVKVRASLSDQAGRLHPGMYVKAEVELPDKRQVVAIASTAVVHAPYGDSVFVVEPMKDSSGKPVLDAHGHPRTRARQQFVRLGPVRGDFVAVEEGIEPGQTVVTAGAFKLRNGAAVAVNNKVQLTPELQPHPENG